MNPLHQTAGARAKRPWRRLGGGLWLLAAAMAVSAQAAGGAASGALAPGDAMQWLVRVQDAAQNRSYQGTVLFSGGGLFTTSKLSHYCEAGQRYERVEVLDGPARLQYRHNEQQVTVWPADRRAVVAPRDAMVEFPALSPVVSLKVLDHYEVRKLGLDRVAGHVAEVLLFKPRDGHRFAQRLWSDRDSGLLLRGEVLGPQGEVLEASGFTELRVGGRAQPETVLGPMKRLEGLQVIRTATQRTQLEAEGWQLARAVPGFLPIASSRRQLDPAQDNASSTVLQTVFSDGLAQVSVFIERYDARRHKQAMRTAMGATHSLMNRQGDAWITVVGEVPMQTLMLFEQALERRP